MRVDLEIKNSREWTTVIIEGKVRGVSTDYTLGTDYIAIDCDDDQFTLSLSFRNDRIEDIMNSISEINQIIRGLERVKDSLLTDMLFIIEYEIENMTRLERAIRWLYGC